MPNLTTNQLLNLALKTFAPNSGGPEQHLIEASLLSIVNLPIQMNWLNEAIGQLPIAQDEWCQDISAACSSELADIFKRYGSDKSSYHDYHKCYGKLLMDRRDAELTVVEIGIGSTNSAVMSNMGTGGMPGASLRAFEAYLPKATLIGADIDRSILFETERIQCVYCNQMEPDGFIDLERALSHRTIDLFIDDGLHALSANLNSLKFALDHTTKGSAIVIEDIHENVAPIWGVIASSLSHKFNCQLLSCLNGYVFVLQK